MMPEVDVALELMLSRTIPRVLKTPMTSLVSNHVKFKKVFNVISSRLSSDIIRHFQSEIDHTCCSHREKIEMNSFENSDKKSL